MKKREGRALANWRSDLHFFN